MSQTLSILHVKICERSAGDGSDVTLQCVSLRLTEYFHERLSRRYRRTRGRARRRYKFSQYAVAAGGAPDRHRRRWRTNATLVTTAAVAMMAAESVLENDGRDQSQTLILHSHCRGGKNTVRNVTENIRYLGVYNAKRDMYTDVYICCYEYKQVKNIHICTIVCIGHAHTRTHGCTRTHGFTHTQTQHTRTHTDARIHTRPLKRARAPAAAGINRLISRGASRTATLPWTVVSAVRPSVERRLHQNVLCAVPSGCRRSPWRVHPPV